MLDLIADRPARSPHNQRCRYDLQKSEPQSPALDSGQFASHEVEEDQKVDGRDYGERERQPPVAYSQIMDGEGGDGIIGQDRDQAGYHRDARIAQSVKRGRQNTNAGIGGQTQSIVTEGGCRLLSIERVESATLIDQGDDRVTEDHQS